MITGRLLSRLFDKASHEGTWPCALFQHSPMANAEAQITAPRRTLLVVARCAMVTGMDAIITDLYGNNIPKNICKNICTVRTVQIFLYIFFMNILSIPSCSYRVHPRYYSTTCDH